MDAQDERTPAGSRRRRIAAIAVGAVAAFGATAAPASAVIVPEYEPDEVARAIIHDVATLDTDNTDWAELATPVPFPLPGAGEEHDPFPAAISEAPLGGFPTSPADFGILSTGDVQIVDQSNDDSGSGDALTGDDPADPLPNSDNGALHGDTDNDVTVLKIGVDVPAGTNCITLDYRFLTEEYPEYVDDQYNDAFIAEIDNLSWSTSNDVISHSGDFATAPNGQPVSVDGVGGQAMTEAEAAGTTFDGATGRVTTKNPITPGPHTIYLSIFDQGDEILDSAVLLDRLAFINESPATCKPPEVPVIVPPPPPPPPPPGPPPPPPPANDINIPGGSVTFANGSATITVQVPGPGTLSAAQASGTSAGASRASIAAAKKQVKLIKPATKTVAKAGKVKLKIKPTKAGLKQLKKKRKLSVRLAITFTPTGGTPNTEVAKITIKAKKKKGKKG